MDEQLPNARTDAAPGYRVWLCGAFRLERRVGTTYEEIETKEWGGHSAPRTVLKALLCAPGRRASRATLLAQLWPDATGEQAARDLNGAISRLRRILRDLSTPQAACLLSTEGDSLGFALPGQEQLWLDADAALALLADAERIGVRTPAALPLLEEACRLFQRGAFLESESDEGEWGDGQRALIERRRYRCRLWLAEAYEHQGRLGDAETRYTDLLRDDPTDEEVIGRLMRLLQQHGLTHQALVLYRQTQELFEREGMELSIEIKALAAQITRERSPLSSRHLFVPGKTTLFFPSSLQQEDISSSRTWENASLSWTDTDVLFRLSTVLDPSSMIGEKEIAYFDEQTRLLWKAREETLLSVSSLYTSVVGHINNLTLVLARSHFPTFRLRLCEITSRAVLLAGVLLYDMGKYAKARHSYQIAFMAAKEANNALLQAIIWGWMSFTWTYEQHYTQAFQCIRSARGFARREQSSQSMVQMWLGAMEAEIQAHLGNRDACLQSLAPLNGPIEPSLPPDMSSLFEFHPVLLLGYKGVCLQQFYRKQDPTTHPLLREAQDALEQALASQPPLKRRLYYLTDLAGIHARQGEMERACALLEHSIPLILSTGNGSKTLRKHLLQVRALLRPYERESFVQVLDEQLAPVLIEEVKKSAN